MAKLYVRINYESDLPLKKPMIIDIRAEKLKDAVREFKRLCRENKRKTPAVRNSRGKDDLIGYIGKTLENQ